LDQCEEAEIWEGEINSKDEAVHLEIWEEISLSVEVVLPETRVEINLKDEALVPEIWAEAINLSDAAQTVWIVDQVVQEWEVEVEWALIVEMMVFLADEVVQCK
jgi:hypothetical protein